MSEKHEHEMETLKAELDANMRELQEIQVGKFERNFGEFLNHLLKLSQSIVKGFSLYHKVKSDSDLPPPPLPSLTSLTPEREEDDADTARKQQTEGERRAAHT